METIVKEEEDNSEISSLETNIEQVFISFESQIKQDSQTSIAKIELNTKRAQIIFKKSTKDSIESIRYIKNFSSPKPTQDKNTLKTGIEVTILKEDDREPLISISVKCEKQKNGMLYTFMENNTSYCNESKSDNNTYSYPIFIEISQLNNIGIQLISKIMQQMNSDLPKANAL